MMHLKMYGTIHILNKLEWIYSMGNLYQLVKDVMMKKMREADQKEFLRMKNILMKIINI